MARRPATLFVLAAVGVGACQIFGGLGDLEFRGAGGGDPGGGGHAGASGGGGGAAGSPGSSGGLGGSAGASTGGGPVGSSSSSSGSGGGQGGSTGLDPALDLPDPGGTPCTNYSGEGECPNLQVCRIATKNSGRCESCDECGNLGATCAMGTDCDIVFECYMNRCTNFCILGSTQCGPPDHCKDIGNDTEGVCWPPL